MLQVGNAFRPTLAKKATLYPWHHWVRLVYNDALTFDASNGSGGVKAWWRFSQFARSPANHQLQAFAVHLQNMKDRESHIFDKLSYADYAVASAYTAITFAGGPRMLDQFTYGRTDASAANGGST